VLTGAVICGRAPVGILSSSAKEGDQVDVSVVIHATLGAPVLGDAGQVLFLLGFLGGLFALVVLLGGLIYRLFPRTSRSTGGRVLVNSAQAPEDLGPFRRSFANYSPWEVRIGVPCVVVGAPGLAIGYFGDIRWLIVPALLALAVGVPCLLQGAFRRIDHLDLHARGLLFREGTSKVIAVYYPDIKSFHYKIVEYSNGPRIIKGLVLELHDGGTLEFGYGFTLVKIREAITEAANADAVE
jgi:hypothetical protein